MKQNKCQYRSQHVAGFCLCAFFVCCLVSSLVAAVGRPASNGSAVMRLGYPNPSLNRLANAQLLDLIRTHNRSQHVPSANSTRPVTNATTLVNLNNKDRKAACAAAPVNRKDACTGNPTTMVFKDRQTRVPAQRWNQLYAGLSGQEPLDPWLEQELEPYLYDMDYVSAPVLSNDSSGPQSNLWDPELRQTGVMHCARPEDCLTPYLPELYYVGDEYMGGWALEGFGGEGVRAAIGPNIAAGDDPRNYNYTYIPYTQRIIFAPVASLFFPYLFSIYAGQVYVAETDPFLLTIAAAARAGIVADYYYVNNYYNFYEFITWGVASSAVLAAAARARGVVGTAFKLRNFNALLASVSRDDYNERNRILLLNGIAFIGASGGGYIFSNPVARNAFIGQNPNVNIPYYAYDYSGATNPFPLQPATG